jgi:flagellar hook-basal body complex protein FliE
MNASFVNATNAYRDALRTAENILQKTTLPGVEGTKTASGPSFLDMVGGALGASAQAGYNSESMAMKALTGKADLTDVVNAVANAETALNTVVAIRDKVINAYQDIIKMPI